jgi:hypothetical protein
MISGVFGALGLDHSLVLQLGIGTHAPVSGELTLVVAVPNNPSLRGLALPTQALVLSGNGEIYLTNTAKLTVK